MSFLQFLLCWCLFTIGKWKSTNRNFGDTRPCLAYKREQQMTHTVYFSILHFVILITSCDLSPCAHQQQQLSLHYEQPIPKNMQTGMRLSCFFLVFMFASASVSAQGNVATQWAQFLDELLLNTSSANIGPNAVLLSIAYTTTHNFTHISIYYLLHSGHQYSQGHNFLITQVFLSSSFPGQGGDVAQARAIYLLDTAMYNAWTAFDTTVSSWAI